RPPALARAHQRARRRRLRLAGRAARRAQGAGAPRVRGQAARPPLRRLTRPASRNVAMQDLTPGLRYAAGTSGEGDAMPAYRSHRTTQGKTQAAARALWRATGTADADLAKPIVAIANSYTQFVPGHVHLKPLGDLVAQEIFRAGAVAKEFHTIAVDDGIAMGHEGMLYSLPSREIIADAVEYMVNAHCADALVCISNCDKITPGMLMAALRLNIPTVFVSGGPMEAGKTHAIDGVVHSKIDLIDAMIASANDAVNDEQLGAIERSACPTCGSCSGMFTANSMNCLTEAIGLALPGNGSTLATHSARKALFETAGRLVVDPSRRYSAEGDGPGLPGSGRAA